MDRIEELPRPFDIKLKSDDERLVVVPAGELDLVTAPILHAAFTEQLTGGSGHVVADLRELTFIDSSGIRTLWQAHVLAERDGLRFSVVPGTGDVSRALRMTGLLDRMHLVEPDAGPRADI